MYCVHVRKPSNAPEASELISRVGSDPEGVWIMEPKLRSVTLSASCLNVSAANILKQEMLSIGGEAAIARGTVSCSVEKSDTVMHATIAQYRRLADKLKTQPFGLHELAAEILDVLECSENGPGEICVGDLTIPSSSPVIMGVLNVTPDSFSDGGLYTEPEKALEHASRMVADGADIIDIGGVSSRPGAKPVAEAEEWRRLEPVLKGLMELDVPVSVDTYRGAVAEKALEQGADMINDITAGSDPRLLESVARCDAAIVLMHMQGTPQTMQMEPSYVDVVSEVCMFLDQRARRAREHGCTNIILDPGIGFGKTVEHNLKLLRGLESIRSLGYPVMVGVSRKSLLGKLLDLPVEDRGHASIAAMAAAVINGADIIRVHDVKESKHASVVAAAVHQGRKP